MSLSVAASCSSLSSSSSPSLLLQAFHLRVGSLCRPFLLLYRLLSPAFLVCHLSIFFLILSLSLSLSLSLPPPSILPALLSSTPSLFSSSLLFSPPRSLSNRPTCFFVINCLITSCEWGHQILSVCSGSASPQIWRVDLPGEGERRKEWV